MPVRWIFGWLVSWSVRHNFLGEKVTLPTLLSEYLFNSKFCFVSFSRRMSSIGWISLVATRKRPTPLFQKNTQKLSISLVLIKFIISSVISVRSLISALESPIIVSILHKALRKKGRYVYTPSNFIYLFNCEWKTNSISKKYMDEL